MDADLRPIWKRNRLTEERPRRCHYSARAGDVGNEHSPTVLGLRGDYITQVLQNEQGGLNSFPTID